MKRLRMWFLIASVLSFWPTAMLAQANCFSYSDNYASYTDESYDGTNIYTTVVVDGQGQMNFIGGDPSCYYINWSSAVHTPIAYNTITWGDSSVGGSKGGTPVCPDCYLSVTNDQSVAATPGTTYNFNWGGEVYCSFGGSLLSNEGWISLAIATTTYKLATININGTTTYTQACPGSSKPSCGAKNFLDAQGRIDQWLEEMQLKVTIGGSSPFCSPVGIVQLLNGPPAPYPCT